MNEKILIFLFFCGGFVAAFCFLLFATFVRRSHLVRWVCLIGAFCGLVYEGGCFMTAAGIGEATGGGDRSGNLMAPVVVGFFIALGWIFALILFVPIKGRRNISQSPGRNKHPPDITDD
jgi:hypothetical protein